MRIGVEASHIGRRFPTLRQYDQVPPVILRLFAPRRVAPLYVRYICRRRAISAGTRRDRWSRKKEALGAFRSSRSIFTLIRFRWIRLAVSPTSRRIPDRESTNRYAKCTEIQIDLCARYPQLGRPWTVKEIKDTRYSWTRLLHGNWETRKADERISRSRWVREPRSAPRGFLSQSLRKGKSSIWIAKYSFNRCG